MEIRNVRLAVLILVLLFFAFAVFGCSEPAPADKGVRVMIAASQGATVTSPAVLDLAQGEDATFTVEITDGYEFDSVDAGSYDPETGTVTLKNVKKSTLILFRTVALGYDTSITVKFTHFSIFNKFFLNFQSLLFEMTFHSFSISFSKSTSSSCSTSRSSSSLFR